MKNKNKRVALLSAFFIALMLIPTVALAEVDPISTINNAKTLLLTIVSAIGVMVLVYGILTLGMAWNREDTAGKTQGINGIVAGVIVAAAPWIVNYLLG